MKAFIILFMILLILLLCGALLILVDNLVIEIVAGITLCAGLLLVFSLLLKSPIESNSSSLRKAPKMEYSQT